MKECYVIHVYILTDSRGEWWEYVKKDGSLGMFKRENKEFASMENAVKAALAMKANNSKSLSKSRLLIGRSTGRNASSIRIIKLSVPKGESPISFWRNKWLASILSPM
jgi:hypothetical protein